MQLNLPTAKTCNSFRSSFKILFCALLFFSVTWGFCLADFLVELGQFVWCFFDEVTLEVLDAGILSCLDCRRLKVNFRLLIGFNEVILADLIEHYSFWVLLMMKQTLLEFQLSNWEMIYRAEENSHYSINYRIFRNFSISFIQFAPTLINSPSVVSTIFLTIEEEKEKLFSNN